MATPISEHIISEMYNAQVHNLSQSNCKGKGSSTHAPIKTFMQGEAEQGQEEDQTFRLQSPLFLALLRTLLQKMQCRLSLCV